jgi:hypothetical protein
MNLKEMAAQMLAEGFKQGDEVSTGFENLPDGIYDAILTNAQWRVNDSGFEWLSLEFEILNEGFENRKYFGMYSFAHEKMGPVNMKNAMNTLLAVGVEKEGNELIELFGAPETALVDAFKEGLGSQVELELKGWENKKTGKSGQNFKVTAPSPF